jgi:hypothetical protein
MIPAPVGGLRQVRAALHHLPHPHRRKERKREELEHSRVSSDEEVGEAAPWLLNLNHPHYRNRAVNQSYNANLRSSVV